MLASAFDMVDGQPPAEDVPMAEAEQQPDQADQCQGSQFCREQQNLLQFTRAFCCSMVN